MGSVMNLFGELLPNLGLLGSTVKAVTTLPSMHCIFKDVEIARGHKMSRPSNTRMDLLKAANGVVAFPQVR
jgi:hypothetical protein